MFMKLVFGFKTMQEKSIDSFAFICRLANDPFTLRLALKKRRIDM